MLSEVTKPTMSQPRLNNMMLLHTHKDITDTIDEFQIAKQFVEVNDRRKLFWHILINITIPVLQLIYFKTKLSV